MVVSVCIPTYNGEKYLQQCIDSVLAQSFTGLEIIICDDCSTDKTVDIIKTYRQKDNRIKLFINDKNLGLVGNWNRCMEQATGEWIKFIFQDDWLEKDCIEKMLTMAGNGNELIVCERTFMFEDHVTQETRGKYGKVLRLERIIPDRQLVKLTAQEVCKLAIRFMPSNFIGEPTSVMFRRSEVPVIGLFSKDIIQLCDYEYWLRIASRRGLIYTSEHLAKFRVHDLSTSNTNNSKKIFSSENTDRVILLNDLLYAEQYADFRKYLTSSEKRILWHKLHFSIFRAKRWLKKHGADDQSVKAYVDYLSAHPYLKQGNKFYPFYYCLGIMIRTYRGLRKLTVERA